MLWTSHNMYEVEEVCDRVLFLSRGKILLEGDPKTLPREHGKAVARGSLHRGCARTALARAMTMQPRRAPPRIALRQFYLVRGSPRAVLPLFAWVAVDIVLWGFITRYLNTVTSPGFNFVPVLLGAVLLWDFFTRVMQGVTMAFFEDVWSRNFLNIFASPLSIAEYLARPGARRASRRARLAWCVMLLLATAVFGLSLLGYGARARAVPAGAVPLRHRARHRRLRARAAAGSGGGVVRVADPGVLSPFAGVFYPLSTLPAWMQSVSRALPPSYVFEGMRGIVLGGRALGAAARRGATLAVLYLLGGMRAVRTRLPQCRSHRPHRALQRRKCELGWRTAGWRRPAPSCSHAGLVPG